MTIGVPDQPLLFQLVHHIHPEVMCEHKELREYVTRSPIFSMFGSRMPSSLPVVRIMLVPDLLCGERYRNTGFFRLLEGKRITMEITIDATGSAPAGAVWERFMDPDRWSSWAPQIQGVEYSGYRLTADTSGRVRGPLWTRIDFEVTSVDEAGWTWSWNAWLKHRSLGLHLTHGVSSRQEGSRTWLTVVGSPAFVLPYAPVAKLALMQLVRA